MHSCIVFQSELLLKDLTFPKRKVALEKMLGHSIHSQILNCLEWMSNFFSRLAESEHTNYHTKLPK